ncbi:MAG TPA: hypothetical protein VHV78_05880 [Gemmatimonadaceae bacterium]|nr:hypothetical protein [Gemmatimonadaceae bacterium]
MRGRRTVRAARPPSPWRVLALVCALLAGASPLLSAAHLAAVRHIRCAEHGELIDAGATESVGPSAAGARFAAVAANAGHGHEHCLAAVGRRGATNLTLAPTPHVLPNATAHRLALPATAPPRLTRLFRLAPKNSPDRG